MAAPYCKYFYSNLLNTYYLNNFSNCKRINLSRLYSQYSSDYQNPVVQKDEIEKILEERDPKEIKLTNFRAAGSYQTSSALYDSDVAKFINYVMREGKKETARKLISDAFTIVKHTQLRKYNKETDEEKKKEIELNPTKVFHEAVKNATPKLYVTKIKKSGTWYQIPVGIKDKQAKFRAMKWIIEAANDKEKTVRFSKELAMELISTAEGNSKSVRKKLEIHKLCENNRSYAHYKWT